MRLRIKKKKVLECACLEVAIGSRALTEKLFRYFEFGE